MKKTLRDFQMNQLLGEKQNKKKVGENNGQVRFRPPPCVAHGSRLDQNLRELCNTHLV